MSEIDSRQQPDQMSSVAGAVHRQPQPDDWDLRVEPMLWFVGIETAVRTMLDHWLASYLSVGLAFFIAGLVVISVLDSHRHSFDKRKAYGLLSIVSVSVLLLHLPFDPVPPSLSLGISLFIIGLIFFRFRAPRWAAYGFGKWITFCLLISASLSFLHLLLSALLSKAMTR